MKALRLTGTISGGGIPATPALAENPAAAPVCAAKARMSARADGPGRDSSRLKNQEVAAARYPEKPGTHKHIRKISTHLSVGLEPFTACSLLQRR